MQDDPPADAFDKACQRHPDPRQRRHHRGEEAGRIGPPDGKLQQVGGFVIAHLVLQPQPQLPGDQDQNRGKGPLDDRLQRAADATGQAGGEDVDAGMRPGDLTQRQKGKDGKGHAGLDQFEIAQDRADAPAPAAARPAPASALAPPRHAARCSAPAPRPTGRSAAPAGSARCRQAPPCRARAPERACPSCPLPRPCPGTPARAGATGPFTGCAGRSAPWPDLPAPARQSPCRSSR